MRLYHLYKDMAEEPGRRRTKMPALGAEEPKRRTSEPEAAADTVRLVPVRQKQVSLSDPGYEEEQIDREKRLVLVDEGYRSDFLRRLNTLRRDKELCDVVLFVNHRELDAHRVVLAALSPTLFEMLSSRRAQHDAHLHCSSEPPSAHPGEPTQQNGHSPVQQPAAGRTVYLEFAHADFESFEALVKYGYTAKLEISENKVADTYKTACQLRIQSCAKACAKYLSDNLSPYNCISVRKCANKMNDSLLAANVDTFIQKNFWEVTQKSKEFQSLPLVQAQVIVAPELVTRELDVATLAEKTLQWFQTQELPEHMEFRMEMLTEKTHLLYLSKELHLRDCCDLDDNSSVGSCDVVQDYKKQHRKRSRSGQPKQQPSPKQANGPSLNSSANGKLHTFPSSESINSVTSSAADQDEIDWKVISVTKTSDSYTDTKRQYLICLVVLNCRLAALSIQMIENAGVVSKSANVIDREMLLVRCIQGGQCRVPLPTMVSARCSVGAVNLNGKLVVCGGYDRGECLRTVEQFDCTINLWQHLAPMAQERGRFDSVVMDGLLYAVGGSDGNKDLGSGEVYDPQTDTWRAIADLKLPRSNNGITAVNGYIYCIGGGNGQVVIKECERYSPAQNKWESIAPLLSGRYQTACTCWAGKVLAVGGCDTWNCNSSVDMYDPQTDLWRQLPAMHYARRGCGVAVIRNKLYVVGGSDGVQSLSSVEVFDLVEGGWSSAPSLSTPRANVAVVAIEDRLYAVGGFSGKSFLNTVEVLEPGCQEWRCWRKIEDSIDEQPTLEEHVDA